MCASGPEAMAARGMAAAVRRASVMARTNPSLDLAVLVRRGIVDLSSTSLAIRM